jgi:hypothetical protein
LIIKPAFARRLSRTNVKTANMARFTIVPRFAKAYHN